MEMPSLEEMKQSEGMPPEGIPSEPMPPEGAAPEGGGDDVDITEFKRGAAAVGQALYSNKEASDAILKGIDPNDKVGTTAQQTITIVTQIDNKLNIELSALFSVAAFCFGELTELAGAASGMEYTEQEQQSGMMTVFEGLVQSYEIDPQEFADYTGESSDQEQMEAQEMYKGAMGNKGEADA